MIIVSTVAFNVADLSQKKESSPREIIPGWIDVIV
jgi:hypothetical protein